MASCVSMEVTTVREAADLSQSICVAPMSNVCSIRMGLLSLVGQERGPSFTRLLLAEAGRLAKAHIVLPTLEE